MLLRERFGDHLGTRSRASAEETGIERGARQFDRPVIRVQVTLGGAQGTVSGPLRTRADTLRGTRAPALELELILPLYQVRPVRAPGSSGTPPTHHSGRDAEPGITVRLADLSCR
jgi:hypothetical protein